MTSVSAKLSLSSRMVDGARHLAELGSWARLAVAFGLGALTATAQAPYYLLPALIVGLSGLVFLLDGAAAARAPKRAAFFTGWAFGFGYFLLGIYWIASAFLTRAEEFAWMIPIAVPALTAFLGLYIAGACWLAAWRWQGNVARVVLLCLCLSVFEFARGILFTGFPWNLFGQSFGGTAVLAQLVAWVGPYGLSFIVTLVAALPAGALSPGASSRRLPLAASLGGMAFIVLFGVLRLSFHPLTFDEDVSLAVYQPNVSQRDKFDPVRRDAEFRTLLDDTARTLPPTGATYAVWPENAYPFLTYGDDFSAYAGDRFPSDAILIAGTLRSVDDKAGRFANGAGVFSETVQTAEGLPMKPVAAIYDKHHLVPFGEYLPFKSLLQPLGLAQLAPAADGFERGAGPQTLAVGPRKFAPLICYEDVFPRALYPANNRPDFLVVMTNDAWFGDNAGPRQHLDISRLRVIESGLPMARSANTGISAIIGPAGRMVAAAGLYEDAQLVTNLPNKMGRTVYDRLGFAALAAVWLLSLAILLIRLNTREG